MHRPYFHLAESAKQHQALLLLQAEHDRLVRAAQGTKSHGPGLRAWLATRLLALAARLDERAVLEHAQTRAVTPATLVFTGQ